MKRPDGSLRLGARLHGLLTPRWRLGLAKILTVPVRKAVLRVKHAFGVRSIFCLAAFCASCVTFEDFDAALSKNVGRPLGEVDYPSVKRVLNRSESDKSTIIQFALSMNRCRWEFEVDPKTDVVLRWRYPDAEAEEWCHSLPTSRP